MQRTIIIILLIQVFGCSPKIQSIVEYQKMDNDLKKVSQSDFDQFGNKIKTEDFGNSRSNRIINTSFEDKRKTFESQCDFFKSHDTCVVRSFSKFKYNKESNIEQETLFESDSAVRLIRETSEVCNLILKKTRTWEFNPKKNPDDSKALVLIDSIFQDRKKRKVRHVHYNTSNKTSLVEIYSYDKNSYSIQTMGTRKDTIINIEMSPLNKWARKNNVDYKFYEGDNKEYELLYY